jgi:mercuric ion transport protein
VSKKESNLPLVGGILAAIGASICCAGPLVLLMLGISGAWIGNLTVFEPYRPLFLVIVAGLFIYAGRQVYRPIEKCDPDSACAIPETRSKRQRLFWITTVIAAILITSNYWIILFV